MKAVHFNIGNNARCVTAIMCMNYKLSFLRSKGSGNVLPIFFHSHCTDVLKLIIISKLCLKVV